MLTLYLVFLQHSLLPPHTRLEFTFVYKFGLEIIFTATIRHLFLSVTAVSVCQLWLLNGKNSIHVLFFILALLYFNFSESLCKFIPHGLSSLIFLGQV